MPGKVELNTATTTHGEQSVMTGGVLTMQKSSVLNSIMIQTVGSHF